VPCEIAGRVEKLGNVVEETLKSWVATSQVTITPVLDTHATSDTTAAADSDPARLGPAVEEAIRSWLGDPGAVIGPVLDLERDWAVDGHDAPEAMREQVVQRDPHCVHPWCQHPARAADLDHITPYVPMDEGGPPGQTAPGGLAPLCRRHHRCKTTGRWRYRRLRDGSYHWTDPHDRHYLVTATGTRELDSS